MSDIGKGFSVTIGVVLALFFVFIVFPLVGVFSCVVCARVVEMQSSQPEHRTPVAVETICDDHEDNDNDGWIDCIDPDCRHTATNCR